MPDATLLPIALLTFGVVVLLMEVLVLYKKNQGFGPHSIRIVGTTIIVVIAAAVAGSSLPLERFTALIGLLGTLAGYIAGRTEANPEA